MAVPGPHIRVNQLTAISNDGTVRFMTYKGMMNAVTFLLFLQKLVEGASRKIVLIADRLQAHKTPEVEAWLAGQQERIEVFYLPSYAPERNPVEYLNDDLKGEVNAAGLPENRGALYSHLRTFMDHLLRVPKQVVSYFLNPWVLYAAPIEI